ncbi:type VII secretion-associated protein [Gordonia sp. ABSL1-1]|uniref:type VII secretion-associated protein n=1 Tax=Gordonia sp. ABSL1-1 TaxID=3053923 RepID=UPI002573EBC8|nr:type VII secretion-associated protein [Gordonia sp. ABSL1-1]MDL9938330.1 type VII secretion-associated protein [Gordonia sp. ABSL1-1]
MPGPQYPTVVDLAYGRPAPVADRQVGDVRGLLDAVDSPTVVFNGMHVHIRQAWATLFARRGLPTGSPDGMRPLVIGHPSTWGPRRTAVFADVGVRAGSAVTLLPRAVLIARSHGDVAMRRCAVVETTHLPSLPVDPARGPRDRWDVTLLCRGVDGWAVESSAILAAAGGRSAVEAILDDTVEAVFVDGADRADVQRAIDLVTAHTVAGRVVAVDRDMVVRYGWRTGAHEIQASVADAPTTTVLPVRRARARSVRLAAAAVAVVVAGSLAVGWAAREDPPDAEEPTTVSLGRTMLAVPARWRQSGQSTPSGTADDPSTTRTQFVGDGGQRIILVQTRVRPDSTMASVAVSLGNRIRHRGQDVVSEFSASTRFAGREVISYREAPASGSAIRWYVVVAHGLQASIGCQTGDGAESVDAECETAVRTVAISPE